MENHAPLQIFLCHASADKPRVRELYSRLKQDQYEPWLDDEDLDPGDEWQVEIPKAVRTAHVVLVCLSKHSIIKKGYVQKEIKIALDVADEQPEGTVFIIPAKLEKCQVPDRLRQWHWVDLFSESGYVKLRRALEKSASSQLSHRQSRGGIQRQPYIPVHRSDDEKSTLVTDDEQDEIAERREQVKAIKEEIVHLHKRLSDHLLFPGEERDALAARMETLRSMHRELRTESSEILFDEDSVEAGGHDNPKPSIEAGRDIPEAPLEAKRDGHPRFWSGIS